MIRFSQNVYISCNMSKAVPLISITSTGDPEAPSYEAQLVDSTVQTLSAAFQSTPVFYPVSAVACPGQPSFSILVDMV